MAIIRTDSGSKQLGFEFWLPPDHCVTLGTLYNLSLSFLISKMRVIIVPTSDGSCED